jgi:branched-chain amino acid transport system substrate-binding protein
VQAITKLINNDGVFFTIEDGGTPMNNATFPMAIEKNVPKLPPLSAARFIYEPFNRLKFSQYSSYVDQIRAGLKAICAMYQDTDFGKDVLAGAVMRTKAMNLKLVGTTAHKATDTDFSASVANLRDANCDLIVLGTIVRDSTLILSTARKAGWNVYFLGKIASHDTAIATVTWRKVITRCHRRWMRIPTIRGPRCNR